MKRGIIFIKGGAVMCKTFSEEERLSLFKKNENVTKEDVLSRIKQKQNRYKEKIKQNGPHPIEYYSLLYVILEAFYKKVYDAVEKTLYGSIPSCSVYADNLNLDKDVILGYKFIFDDKTEYLDNTAKAIIENPEF